MINSLIFGLNFQKVERTAFNRKVLGSSPSGSKFFPLKGSYQIRDRVSGVNISAFTGLESDLNPGIEESTSYRTLSTSPRPISIF